MKKFRVYGIISASKFIGEYEAETEDRAEEMADKDGDWHVSLCHQCSGEVELGDIYETQVDEAGDSNG